MIFIWVENNFNLKMDFWSKISPFNLGFQKYLAQLFLDGKLWGFLVGRNS